MVWNLTEANEYIKFNAIDNEDFLDSDDDRKQMLLNVSKRTIDRKFKDIEIPNEAYYLFGSALGAIFNDTNKMAQQGVASFGVSGINFTFKDGIGSKNGAPVDLAGFIPDEVYEMLGVSRARTMKWTVL
ncbi:hypothetical protein [Priestia megaterium]|uniref:hypothetical protein n=1 Tax=Priestia megaterium TaxID=1404 RepID=UPI001DFC621B|nr:hypothetical protein [Priestia megaterium]CAH0304966.1 hypothetical protein SRABI82_04692 [Priestia megaterium]